MPKKTKKTFKPHMMYHPKTGEASRADTHEQHLALKKKGYGHSAPKKKKKKSDSFPEAVERRLKGGY
tara:strand:+ start:191 stop:391 length:201 start_codon:yes stop_codon:yes gene_type:complete